MYWAIALAAYQVYAGEKQADEIRKNAELSQEIANENADLADLDAYRAEIEGYSEEARYQTAIDHTVGQQRTYFASKNVDVGFGTAAELQEEAKLTGFLNKLDIKNQAHERAMGYRREAENLRRGGAVMRRQGEVNANAVRESSYINAASTGISGYERYSQRLGESKDTANTKPKNWNRK